MKFRERGAQRYMISVEEYGTYATAPRRLVRYRCPRDHEFEVPFADAADVAVPPMWECRLHRLVAHFVNGPKPLPSADKPPRTHWDMVLERRTIAELDALLRECLAVLRQRPAQTGDRR